MSVIGDLVSGVVETALKEILKKTTGAGKRARRRKSAASPTERLRQIEKLLKPTAKPARKQVSRRRTVRTRAKTKRRAY